MKLFIGLLFLLSVLVQLLFGPVRASFFAFPINMLILVSAVYVAYAEVSLSRRKGKSSQLGSIGSSLWACSAMIICMIVLGLVPQLDAAAMQNMSGLWLRLGVYDWVHSWPFCFAMLWLITVLAAVVVRRLTAGALRGTIPFLLNHVGLWLALASGFAGACDEIRLSIPVDNSYSTSIGYTTSNKVYYIPFSIRLDDFRVERFDNGEPALFEANLTVDAKGKQTQGSVSVNHPLHCCGYDIYLTGYDAQSDARVSECVLLAVRQPWKWPLAAGIVMMIAGAVMLFVNGVKTKKRRADLSDDDKPCPTPVNDNPNDGKI